jgi:hypothetical protein
MRKNMKRTGFVAVSALALSTVGLAFAAWTANGTGDGSVQAGEAVALGVDAPLVNELYPTKSVEVLVDVTNDNPYDVTIDSVTPGSVSTDAAGCSASAVTVETLSAQATKIAAGDTEQFSLTVEMSNAAEDECQNAVFEFDVTAAGLSS